MESEVLEERIKECGRELFAGIAGEKPSLFDSGTWLGRIMEWSMRDEQFKTNLFRFIDVYPSLVTGKLLSGHISEYFGEVQDDHPLLAAGARLAGALGGVGGLLLNRVLDANIREMARQFIVAEDTDSAVKRLKELRDAGFAAVIDVLGEATLSEYEAETYVATYLGLLDAMAHRQGKWPALPGAGEDPALDWGSAPMVNVAVKPTALYCLASPQDFEGSVQAILARMRRICAKVVELNGFLCIDMESYRFKEITLEVYRRLKLEFRSYPHLGVVLQSYLKDTDRDLRELLEWAQQHETRISIRLVKGAYWDMEVVRARQNGWEVPVWTEKAESDAAFERQARVILEHHQSCYFACASHNIRSVAAVMAMARTLEVPSGRYEFQLLYGMAEPVRKGILKIAGRVRLYSPYGSLVTGMGYLVRRLLENTSNESFLRKSFADETEQEQLLRNPLDLVRGTGADSLTEHDRSGFPPFSNEPMVDFTREEHREAFPREIAALRARLGMTCPLFIGGVEVLTDSLLHSNNPNNPDEILGQVSLAGPAEVHRAIAAARKAFPAWRDTPPGERAEYLLKAAEGARRRIFELAAWQILEIGKQWDQAYGDITEAIDFLEYYAREMIRLGELFRLGRAPGELNHYFYEPRGVAAVIAPWNFPLAISTGMSAAAIVAGNCVIFKPSSLTPMVGWQLCEIYREAGLPAGVFNYLPGRSSEIGDTLVDDPEISVIAFTGSMEAGLRIVERAARVHQGQTHVKKVIAEMGGKNAIIIDDDADLDEAIPAVLQSAFGFQGQKCSACSRVIILDQVHDRFVSRLLEMAKSLKVGPAEHPGNFMGAVSEEVAMRRINRYIEEGKKEGRLLFQGTVPSGGYFVPLTIFGGIRPEHLIAREEIFGPVLALMHARNFDQALEWANGTRFALTGGLFCRHPAHIARARKEFRVGNLYINRGITGALVERQPFGGSRMSGIGSKAGGPDYLLQFMEPRVITENTMRRGFAPEQ